MDTDSMTTDISEAKAPRERPMGRWILFRGPIWAEVDLAAAGMGRTISEYLEICHNQKVENDKTTKMHFSQMEEMRSVIAEYRKKYGPLNQEGAPDGDASKI